VPWSPSLRSPVYIRMCVRGESGPVMARGAACPHRPIARAPRCRGLSCLGRNRLTACADSTSTSACFAASFAARDEPSKGSCLSLVSPRNAARSAQKLPSRKQSRKPHGADSIAIQAVRAGLFDVNHRLVLDPFLRLTTGH